MTIVDTYHQLPEQLKRDGDSWYWEANRVAEEIGEGDAWRGAGIIAALSPRVTWKQNQVLARYVAAGVRPKGLGRSIDKAMAIAAGQPVEEAIGHWPKCYPFAQCIADPEHPTAVVLDVWMARYWSDDPDWFIRSSVRTESARDEIRDLASDVGAAPAPVQAALWLNIRGGGR